MGTVGDRAFNDNDEITFLGSRVPRQTAKFTCQKRREETASLPLEIPMESTTRNNSPRGGS